MTSKSCNSSISSILKDTSAIKPKKQQSVRFEDSPSLSEKTVHINLSEICNSIKTPQVSFFKDNKPVIFNQKNDLTSTNQSPIKSLIANEIPEPRFIPKTINYSFRNQNFYEKLNKFYNKNSSQNPCNSKASTEKVFIKLDVEKKFKTEEKNHFEQETTIIHLLPCSKNPNLNTRDSRLKSLSPTRESKPSPIKKNRGHYGQNILN